MTYSISSKLLTVVWKLLFPSLYGDGLQQTVGSNAKGRDKENGDGRGRRVPGPIPRASSRHPGRQ